MEKLKKIHDEMDVSLDELDALEYDIRAVAYVLEQMQETLNHRCSGIEMVFVWIVRYLQSTDNELRETLNKIDKSLMKLYQEISATQE